MTMRLLSLLLLSFVMACGGKQIKFSDAAPRLEVKLNEQNTIRVIGNHGVASACAVNGYVITAGHVVAPFTYYPGLYREMVGYAWSDYNEPPKQGYFTPGAVSPFRDIGVIFPDEDGDNPFQHKLSTSALQPGDHLRWIEYDRGDDYFKCKEASGTVIRLIAGHIMIDGEATQGASGTCVFNDQGTVVGIISWGINGTTVVINLTGRWWLDD